MTTASVLSALEKAGKTLEDAILVLILSAMILTAAGQILLRNLFDIGFFWSDELLRLLVLWLAVAGAVAASRKDRHISIAVLDQFLSAPLQRFNKIIIDAFTAVICALITWHSAAFVRSTHEFGDTMLGDVPAWLLQMVLPVGFALISWRYALFAVRGILGTERPEQRP